jgi:hypothetical protein
MNKLHRPTQLMALAEMKTLIEQLKVHYDDEEKSFEEKKLCKMYKNIYVNALRFQSHG